MSIDLTALQTTLKRITTKWVQSRVSKVIHDIWVRTDNLLILTTWSSWRAEKYGELDDVELLIYSFWELWWVSKQDVCEALKNDSKFKFLIEPKEVDSVDSFEWMLWEARPKTFFPSRHIDTRVIFGEYDNMTHLNNIFIQLIRRADGKLVDDWKSRIRTHKNMSIKWEWKWKWELFKIFDSDEKTLHYLKSSSWKQISLKLWALRYLQYKIVYLLIKLIKTGRLDEMNIANIWRSIREKLTFISDFWVTLSQEKLDELVILYKYFLLQHENMVEIFRWRESWKITMNDKDFQDFLEYLQIFNQLVWELSLKN